MLINFNCENCGKGFSVDEHAHGKRGRCSNCGHVMRIPGAAAAGRADAAATASSPEIKPDSEPPFPAQSAGTAAVCRPIGSSFCGGPCAAQHAAISPNRKHRIILASRRRRENRMPASPTFDSSCLTMTMIRPRSVSLPRPTSALSKKSTSSSAIDADIKSLATEMGCFLFWALARPGPASWPYVKWKAAVNFVLKLLRWVDTWAYLISVPFIILMVFGIVVENRAFVHLGAVVTVLANYGRFWADLVALFVRPYKDGPIQGMAFLFPPYTVYYLATRWSRMKPILRRIATSCIPIVLVVLAYAFLPSINPEVKDVAGRHRQDRKGQARGG